MSSRPTNATTSTPEVTVTTRPTSLTHVNAPSNASTQPKMNSPTATETARTQGSSRRDASVRHVGSFEEYWEPVEAGTGQMPQACLALPDHARRTVRADVHERLAALEIDGRYHLSVEMLIASGQK